MFSLIIPVYRNQDTIPPLLQCLVKLHERLGRQLDVVFVVDGSPDGSHALLREQLSNGPFPAQLVHLSRNFGSFAAIRAGLSVAQGPFFAVMAADLQEPPELIADFFTTLRDESVDVVVGARADRDDPAFSRFSAQAFWALYRLLVQRDMPPGGVDVFACNRAVRDALLQLHEVNTSLIGQLFWVGFRRKALPYKRLPRSGGGRSGWTFRKKVRYLLDSIFAFTDLPVTLMTAVGVGGVVISVLTAAVVFTSWLLGDIPVPGYTPIMLLLVFSTSLQLFSAGILGSYLWRTYENTKGRPPSITMTHEQFPREAPP
jgi:glycosyltransferase involved in cell wall biosynthesis